MGVGIDLNIKKKKKFVSREAWKCEQESQLTEREDKRQSLRTFPWKTFPLRV